MVDREKGSNSLRGGKNIYAAKTKVGNWVEEEYKPGVPTRGFSTRRFVTTTVHQQLDGCGRSTTEVGGFGVGVMPAKPTSRFNYADIINPDTTATGASWETVTKSVHVKPKEGSQTEFSTTFKLRGGLPDREALAKYREEWTSDTPLGASMRFKTSAAEGQSGTPAQFRAQTLRKLPGTPLAVERLRSKLIDNSGFSAILEIKKCFRELDASGDGTLQGPELRGGLAGMGITLSDGDFDGIFKFFDSSGDGSIDIHEFAARLRGTMKDSRVTIIKEVFNNLDKTGDGFVTVDDLRGVYDVHANPDVSAGSVSADVALQNFLAQWDLFEKDGKISVDDFIEYYHDLGSLIDDDVYFEWMIRSAWKIGSSSYIPSADKAFKGHNDHHSH